MSNLFIDPLPDLMSVACDYVRSQADSGESVVPFLMVKPETGKIHQFVLQTDSREHGLSPIHSWIAKTSFIFLRPTAYIAAVFSAEWECPKNINPEDVPRAEDGTPLKGKYSQVLLLTGVSRNSSQVWSVPYVEYGGEVVLGNFTDHSNSLPPHPSMADWLPPENLEPTPPTLRDWFMSHLQTLIT